jgi:hypothetical protein
MNILIFEAKTSAYVTYAWERCCATDFDKNPNNVKLVYGRVGYRLHSQEGHRAFITLSCANALAHERPTNLYLKLIHLEHRVMGK